MYTQYYGCMLMGMDTVEFWNSYYGYGMNITTELWTVDWWTAVDLDLDRDLIKMWDRLISQMYTSLYVYMYVLSSV